MNGPPSKIRHSAATDIGLARDANEDSYLVAPPLFAVADGMGGHNAGDVASQTAVEVLRKEMGEGGGLAEAVQSANMQVYRKASSNPDQSGMGTTMTAIVATDDVIEIAHVGDSRAYLLRDGNLSRLTRDHTLVERMVREGRLRTDEAEHHPRRSILERALGVDPNVDVDTDRIHLTSGDRILLCTDGLTGMLGEDQIEEILAAESDPEAASMRLVSEAVTAGGSDNVTVIVVDFPGDAQLAPGRGFGGRRRLAILAAIAAVAALAFGLGRAALLSAWYVGAEGGRVTIFRGVPGSFAGIEVKQVARRTELDAESLPEVYRRRVSEGITAKSRDEAERIVRELSDLQGSEGGAG